MITAEYRRGGRLRRAFFVRFRASNGEIILQTEMYRRLDGALNLVRLLKDSGLRLVEDFTGVGERGQVS